jgi:nucleoside phosphorylase
MVEFSRTAARVDFAVIAPLEEEITKLLEAFGLPVTTQPQTSPSRITYYDAEVSQGPDRTTRVRIVRLAEQGVLNTAVAVTQLILDWKPWCVVSFGIAGGFISGEKDGVSLLDVLVPSSVYYYEPAKDAPGTPKGVHGEAVVQPRAVPFNTDTMLPYIHLSGPAAAYRVKHGLLASGERKMAVSGSRTRKELNDINATIQGVDMESAGVGAAVAGTAVAMNGFVRFLVVKGVSDNASKEEQNRRGPKRDARRLQAAANAADHLHRIVKAAKPPRHVDAPEIPVAETRQMAETVIDAFVPPKITQEIDLLRLQRIIHPIEALPPVFYHWRTLHTHVHWIEFMQFLIVRRLAAIGFSIHLLVDDLDQGVNFAEARRNTTRIVAAVIGQRASIHWLRDLYRHEGEYKEYANAQGFDADSAAMLENKDDQAPGGNGRWRFHQWLPYIAWESRGTGRCIVSVWLPQKGAYDVLRQILSLRPFFIYRPDYLLGGQPGKLEDPGKQLVIEPPHYRAIVDWLTSAPDAQVVEELNMYLTIGGTEPIADVTNDSQSILRESPELVKTLNENTVNTAFTTSVQSLLSTLAGWNERFFSGWDEATQVVDQTP